MEGQNGTSTQNFDLIFESDFDRFFFFTFTFLIQFPVYHFQTFPRYLFIKFV